MATHICAAHPLQALFTQLILKVTAFILHDKGQKMNTGLRRH